MIFGERIRYLRKSEGLSQAGLAKKLRLKRGTVSAWEAGISHPQSALLIEVAEYFHVSVDYLTGLDSREHIRIDHLTEEQKALIRDLINCFYSMTK